MKRIITRSILGLLIALIPFTASAEAACGFSWHGYDLAAVWMTPDKADLSIPNLRSDGQFALVRVAPAEGTISYDVINEYAGTELFLRLAGGEQVLCSSLMFHTLITPEDGGFPTVAPEQNNFDLLFFLEGRDETALEGAEVVISADGAEQSIPLNAISREKPAE